MSEPRQSRHRACMARVDRWLSERNARFLWHTVVKDIGDVRAYGVSGQVVLVVEFMSERGFEMFVPPTDSNDIDATLAAVDRIISKKGATDGA